MIHQPSSTSRIPGELPKIKQREVYLKSLDKYTTAELEELLNRQKHLLLNQKRLAKLPDKGERIKACHCQLEKAVLARNEMNTAAALFSELNIAAKGKPALANMEWHGKYNGNFNNECATLDSDDDPDTVDPIKVLAQSRDISKKVLNVEVEPTLITASDLADVHSFAAESKAIESLPATSDMVEQPPVAYEPHAINMCAIEDRHDKNKTKYLPHKTTVSNVHSVDKEKARKHGKHWEITAATPPTMRNSEVKLLSLMESMAVQQQQKESLKKFEEQHAVERLLARKTLMSKLAIQPNFPMSSDLFRTYRDVDQGDEDDDEEEGLDELDSDNEVHDTDDEPRGGVFVEVYEK